MSAAPNLIRTSQFTTTLKVIGIAEMIVSGVVTETLVTYSLGSCVAISLFDPVVKVGGLIHCMLPSSIRDKEKAQTQPCMFVDTGIVKLIDYMMDQGAQKERLICKMAGGASPLNDSGHFKIGDKNVTVTRKLLEKNHIPILGECIGGSRPITVFLEVGSGITRVRVSDDLEREI